MQQFPYGPQLLLQAQLELCDTLLPVEFALHAPLAQKVFLIGEMTRWREEKLPMQRDAQGVWRLQLRLRRGQWFYKFEVDGVWIADPANPQRAEDGIGYGNDHSYLFVGEGDWTPRPALPQGEIFEVTLRSSLLGCPVPFCVYLPPGAERGAELPLLCLLHGHAVRRNQWPANGCLGAYMDNLQYEGVIAPFAVVMPSGHVDVDMRCYGRFLVEELLPWLALRLPVSASPRLHAVGGMSVAGYGPLALALDFPEAFRFVAPLNEIFSDAVIAAAPQLGSQPFALELFGTLGGCSSPRYEALIAAARSAGVRVHYMGVPGVPTWHYWNKITRAMLRAASEQFAR